MSKMCRGASGRRTPKSLPKASGTVWEVSGESPESVWTLESAFGLAVPGLFGDFPGPGPETSSRLSLRSEKLQNGSSPEFFNFFSRILPRILLRIFPEIFKDPSCFVSCETETRKNSPKIPAIFQCKIPGQIRKKYSRKFSGEQAK